MASPPPVRASDLAATASHLKHVPDDAKRDHSSPVLPKDVHVNTHDNTHQALMEDIKSGAVHLKHPDHIKDASAPIIPDIKVNTNDRTHEALMEDIKSGAVHLKHPEHTKDASGPIIPEGLKIAPVPPSPPK